MIDPKAVAVICEYAKKVVEENICGDGDIIAMRTKSGIVATNGCALSEVDESKIVLVQGNESNDKLKLIATLFAAREDVNAAMITHPEFICAVARAKATIPAVVDDVAQIVGVTTRTSKSDSVEDVMAAMKGRNSCLIAGGGALSTGRTMSEAYTCALVLEKAAHVYVCGSVIGGCKIINSLEARLMRFVYKKKYSKTNQKNISEKEGE